MRLGILPTAPVFVGVHSICSCGRILAVVWVIEAYCVNNNLLPLTKNIHTLLISCVHFVQSDSICDEFCCPIDEE